MAWKIIIIIVNVMMISNNYTLSIPKMATNLLSE
jgi:hypothetical protein